MKLDLSALHSLPEGYDMDGCSFGDEDETEFECGICYLPVRKAVRCSNGHLFCANCIGRWTININVERDANRQTHSTIINPDLDPYLDLCTCRDCLCSSLFVKKVRWMLIGNHQPTASLEAAVRIAIEWPLNECPVCRVVGGYIADSEVDQRLLDELTLCDVCDWAGRFADRRSHACQPKAKTLKRQREDDEETDTQEAPPSKKSRRSQAGGQSQRP